MKFQILKPEPNWEGLYFYQKSVVLYQLTFAFTRKFLERSDRTIDQMVQAARSGKQNIVEGSADGMSSKEMELKLVNVARASLQELREDYEDYLDTRHLRWTSNHPRFETFLPSTQMSLGHLMPRMLGAMPVAIVPSGAATACTSGSAAGHVGVVRALPMTSCTPFATARAMTMVSMEAFCVSNLGRKRSVK